MWFIRINKNPNNTVYPPCIVIVDVNGDKKPNYISLGGEGFNTATTYACSMLSDKKLTDIFTIMITDEKAIPFGVVAQRAMYSSK